MATKKSLQDAISIVDPVINEILSKDYRTELDKRITVLDLSYNALKVNVYRNTSAHLEAYDYAYRTLVEVLGQKATRQYTSLDQLPAGYFDKANAPFVYINGGDNNRFIVARTFGAARDFVTKIISRDPKLMKTSFGQRTVYKDVLNKNNVPSGDTIKSTRTKIDIGHISTEGEDNLVSPLEMKFADILQLGIARGSPIIINEAKRALSDLYAVQASASYSFKNTTPEAISLAKSVLGEVYVVVTLHREKLNAAFSKEELAIYNRLRAALAMKLSKADLHEVSGSNTIVQDIWQGLLFTITGKSKDKPKPHTVRTVKTKSKVVKPNISVTGTSVQIKKPKSKPTPTSFSLTTLQNLLNGMLPEQIRGNMGTGSSVSVLNNRTGRLSDSASVERMSISRNGMITAFYSYMKNPYATFSTGGRQQTPRSRDPRLLISKSIREIATTHVSNQLRAVNI